MLYLVIAICAVIVIGLVREWLRDRVARDPAGTVDNFAHVLSVLEAGVNGSPNEPGKD